MVDYIKVKIAEATDNQLDWGVASAIGVPLDFGLTDDERFTTDWSQGGPIIEDKKINITMSATAPWMAFIYDGLEMLWMMDGSTPLRAAMRCLIASVYGEEFDVPEGLT